MFLNRSKPGKFDSKDRGASFELAMWPPLGGFKRYAQTACFSHFIPFKDSSNITAHGLYSLFQPVGHWAGKE